MPKRKLDFVIVGAGIFGATCAEVLTRAGRRCLVVERRDHLGGNCYTRLDEEVGVHEHVYGAHIFHTNSADIWSYIRRFGEFAPYVHRVRARSGSRLWSLPINLETLDQLYGVKTTEEAAARLEAVRVKLPHAAANLEEWCLSQIGPDLYSLLIEGYTTKQWGRHPRELSASIVRRLPIRLDRNDAYFDDTYQGVPTEGYTALFERMLDGVPIALGTDALQDRDYWLDQGESLIFSGPIDEFFGATLGRLDYRSLRFERELVDTDSFQDTAVVNYCDTTVPWTRVIEHQHFMPAPRTGRGKSLITREYPLEASAGNEPYYPVADARNLRLATEYRKMAARLAPKIYFGGRLGDYQYYDMHQAIGSAMALCRKILG